MKTVLFAIMILASSSAAYLPSPPEGLLCDLLRDPVKAFITDQKPEFSWIVGDTNRGAVQSAFQILVCSDPDLLKKNQADVWDSGKVPSDQSVNVEYNGKNLLPHCRYWWKVRTWNGLDQPSAYSQSQEFLTGDLRRDQLAWPDESRWIKTENGEWFLENRQRAEYASIKPKKIQQNSPSVGFYDFGRAAFGTLKLTVRTTRDTDSAVVYLGERCIADSIVHKNPGRSNIGFKRSVIALKKGRHTYTVQLPRHVSHYPNSQVLAEHMTEVAPFRYAEIFCTSQVDTGSVRQQALFYYFDENASHFTSSNENLNRVWELCKYTLKATPFLALYADGNRERMPYEADAYIQQLGHYAVDREYSVGRYTNQFLIFKPAWPTEWHMHTVLMAWADYLQTGNLESVAKYYLQFKAKTLLALTETNGLISSRTGKVTPEFLKSIHFKGNNFEDIVDWPKGTPAGGKQDGYRGPTPEGERDGYVFTDYNTVVNSFHCRSLLLLSRLAGALGDSAESQYLNSRVTQVKESINTLLFDKNRGIYVDGIGTNHTSLHANMFPLAFGLVPQQYIPSVVKFIKSRDMACSVYGAQYLLDALYSAGEAQYALDLLTRESKRSWMNMIRVGSTMTTEAWDEYYKPNLTWNHAWGSAPANIIVRKLFGIEPLEPAFRTVKIHPQPGNLEFARLKTPTIRGYIYCDWLHNGNRFTFTVILPANMRGHVYLPNTIKNDLCESGQPLLKKEQNTSNVQNTVTKILPDMKVLETTESHIIISIGAGRYIFSGSLE
ncbi:alpha-L-rhamnosidase [candidate division KSB1 bacterium]|nr:alpha-L-rhamnosidase [candidate division KSB1 bacterium]